MSVTPDLSTPAPEMTDSEFDSGIRSHTEAVAWAMFVAGYHARIEDSTREAVFQDRDAFDAHLYEQFRDVYTDS